MPVGDKDDARLVVSQIILDTLDALRSRYPKTSAKRRKELSEIRKQLAKDDDKSNQPSGRNTRACSSAREARGTRARCLVENGREYGDGGRYAAKPGARQRQSASAPHARVAHDRHSTPLP
ncbi:hypothetical protein QZM52_24840 [Burkholderia metallica]|uniref:Uncharacterized protein n=1 Tax=Burkholderia metallica TaxID=488729 RepID=A0ABT8PJD5_9BURK|nr:hypothetical protein [Burkholderia metallica]MDN7934518.1 hypothetical protein [Burkholderia metallica]